MQMGGEGDLSAGAMKVFVSGKTGTIPSYGWEDPKGPRLNVIWGR